MVRETSKDSSLIADLDMGITHGTKGDRLRGRQLSDYGEASDDIARCDQDAVLRPFRKQPREIVPSDGEALNDAQQIEHPGNHS